MTNSQNSDSSGSQTAATPNHLKLWLAEYLTPSLNVLLGQHWTTLNSEKKKARSALYCALYANLHVSSTRTILQEAVNRLSTKCDMQGSSRTIRRTKSKSFSCKKKSKKVKRAR